MSAKKETSTETSINSIQDFVKWVGRKRSSAGELLYRGFSLKSYDPDASIARRIRDSTSQDMWRTTVNLIDGAKRQGYDRDFTRRGDALRTDFELLAILQHQGAATPLMDFSRNPFVALWFACQSQSSSDKDKNGKVIVINPSDFTNFQKVNVWEHVITLQGVDIKPEDKENKAKNRTQEQPNQLINTPNAHEKLWRFTPPGFDARILAQNSEFILGKVTLAKTDIMAECYIQESKKEEMLQELEQLYGISEENLFQDLAGYARINAQNRLIETASEYTKKGADYSPNKKYDEAISNFTKAIELDPNEAKAYAGRGAIEVQLTPPDLVSAIKDFTKAIELGFHEAGVYTVRGAIKTQLTPPDLLGAIEDFTKAIELDPNDAAVYENRGITKVYLNPPDPQGAIDDYNEAIELGINGEAIYCNRGSAKAQLNPPDLQGAIADYTKVIELKSYYTEAYHDHGAGESKPIPIEKQNVIYGVQKILRLARAQNNQKVEQLTQALLDNLNMELETNIEEWLVNQDLTESDYKMIDALYHDIKNFGTENESQLSHYEIKKTSNGIIISSGANDNYGLLYEDTDVEELLKAIEKHYCTYGGEVFDMDSWYGLQHNLQKDD